MIRIGIGTDIHQLAESRDLILAGIKIPHHLGLLGHSDADVIIHAVIDAILGALAWGDIGSWFPDTDQTYKDIDSSILLTKVWKEATAKGWNLVNLDISILIEKPKLRPYIDEMRAKLAELLGAALTQVSIKATTAETLGFVGRAEGVLAQAVVLIES